MLAWQATPRRWRCPASATHALPVKAAAVPDADTTPTWRYGDIRSRLVAAARAAEAVAPVRSASRHIGPYDGSLNDCEATAPTPASTHSVCAPARNAADWIAAPSSPVSASRATIEYVTGASLPERRRVDRDGARGGAQDDALDRRRAGPHRHRDPGAAEPRPQPAGVASHLDPLDLQACAARARERAARLPGDEERQARLRRGVLDTGGAPAQRAAVGRLPRARHDGEAEPARGRIEVTRTHGPAHRPGRRGRHPAPEPARRRLGRFDDGDELEVGVAQWDDPVGRAPAGVAAAGRDREPEALGRGRRRIEVGRRDQQVVDGDAAHAATVAAASSPAASRPGRRCDAMNRAAPTRISPPQSVNPSR